MDLLRKSWSYCFVENEVIGGVNMFSVTTKKGSIELCTINALENLSKENAAFLYHDDMIMGKTNMGKCECRGGGLEY